MGGLQPWVIPLAAIHSIFMNGLVVVDEGTGSRCRRSESKYEGDDGGQDDEGTNKGGTIPGYNRWGHVFLLTAPEGVHPQRGGGALSLRESVVGRGSFRTNDLFLELGRDPIWTGRTLATSVGVFFSGSGQRYPLVRMARTYRSPVGGIVARFQTMSDQS